MSDGEICSVAAQYRIHQNARNTKACAKALCNLIRAMMPDGWEA